MLKQEHTMDMFENGRKKPLIIFWICKDKVTEMNSWEDYWVMLSILTEITLFFIMCGVLMIFSQIIWIILSFRQVPELSVCGNLMGNMN